VTRPGVRAPLSDLAPGERALEGAAARYLARVLRLRAGDAFVAFDPDAAREADAEVTRVDRARIVVRVGTLRPAAVRATRGLTFIQGLAKGDKCDAVVRDATELGATRVIVAETARSVVRLAPGARETRRARWTRIAREAARQSGRGEAPVIDPPCAWGEALGRVPPGAARFCLHERASEPLGPPLRKAIEAGRDLAFAVGAEGGLDDDEVAHARDLGWTLASLGPRVLRTETVCAAVLGSIAIWG
jgi:16S rRNA (uracil1498-N3)-methyltransferase